ncbi:hypothetical protein Tco_1379344 [Tanacetum coccineum]
MRISFQTTEVVDYRWTIDHPLNNSWNPTMPVQTRQQLPTYPKMCMFAITVSAAESKNIKEAMADSYIGRSNRARMDNFIHSTDLKSGETNRRQTSCGVQDRIMKAKCCSALEAEEVFVALRPEGIVDPDHPEKV